MKKIKVLSHDEAVHYKPSVKTSIIRLLDSDAMLKGSNVTNKKLLFHDDFSSVHELVVDDIKRSFTREYPGSVLFSRKHALYLKDVFEKCKEDEEVIVHCRAGVSRSGAVAILLARYLERIDLECDIYLNHNILPNSHILSFQDRMGIPSWDKKYDKHMDMLTKQMLGADHESMVYTVDKILALEKGL